MGRWAFGDRIDIPTRTVTVALFPEDTLAVVSKFLLVNAVACAMSISLCDVWWLGRIVKTHGMERSW